MKQLKLYISFLLLSVSLIAFSENLKNITILHTNDLHSRIMPVDKNARYNAGKGGFVRIITAVKEERKKDKDLLLFDCGDFSQGTPYYNLFRGKVEIDLMNQAGYNAGILGNHEFDSGMENLKSLIESANFPFICTNYDFSKSILNGFLKKYIIIEDKGVKIGVIGLSPILKGLVAEKNYGNVVYKDAYKCANEIAGFLKNIQHCDIVICLSHLGFKSKFAPNDCDLAASSENIDLILGGHSHTFLKKPVYIKNAAGREIPVSQMGKNGIYLGYLRVYLEK